jgi:hypothetical protein
MTEKAIAFLDLPSCGVAFLTMYLGFNSQLIVNKQPNHLAENLLLASNWSVANKNWRSKRNFGAIFECKRRVVMNEVTLKHLITTMKMKPSNETTISESIPPEIDYLFEIYESYRNDTLQGSQAWCNGKILYDLRRIYRSLPSFQPGYNDRKF